MNQIEKAILDHEEKCNINNERKFISWRWLVGITVGVIIILVTTAWSLSAGITSTKIKLVDHENVLQILNV